MGRIRWFDTANGEQIEVHADDWRRCSHSAEIVGEQTINPFDGGMRPVEAQWLGFLREYCWQMDSEIPKTITICTDRQRAKLACARRMVSREGRLMVPSESGSC